MRWGLRLVDEVRVPKGREQVKYQGAAWQQRRRAIPQTLRAKQAAATESAEAARGVRSHDVELVALHRLRGRVLQIVVSLVVHIPIVARVNTVVVPARQ